MVRTVAEWLEQCGGVVRTVAEWLEQCGGVVRTVAEWLEQKLRWRWNEQVCQGVKCKVL